MDSFEWASMLDGLDGRWATWLTTHRAYAGTVRGHASDLLTYRVLTDSLSGTLQLFTGLGRS